MWQQLVKKMWMADPIRIGHVEKIDQMWWCHVAQACATMWHPVRVEWKVLKNVWASMGFEPMTTHHSPSLGKQPNTNTPHMSLIICNVFKYIYVVKFGRAQKGGGWG